WSFAAIAKVVSQGRTQDFDNWALRALRRADNPAMPIGPEWMHEIGRDLKALGGIAVLTLMIAAVAGYQLLRQSYGAMWLVIFATLGGLVMSSLLKGMFERERPAIVPHLSHVMTTSFPSGHSMLSAVVYLTLGALMGRFVQGAILKAYFLFVA